MICQKLGCPVLLADIRSTPELESWLKKVEGSPTKVVYQLTDVAQWDQLKRLVDVAKKEFGDVPDVYETT